MSEALTEQRIREIVREETCQCGYCKHCIRRYLQTIVESYKESLVEEGHLDN